MSETEIKRELNFGLALVSLHGDERPVVMAVTRDNDALLRALKTFLSEEEFLADYLREKVDEELLRECQQRSAALLAMRAMALMSKAELAMTRADAALAKVKEQPAA